MVKEKNASVIHFQEKKEKIVLLVHAYQTTPIVFDQLSRILYENGYSIYNIRLGGHGTVDEDRILDYGWNDWVRQVENIYLDMASMFKEVYGIGLCLGADILLEVALRYSSIKKLVVYSPPFFLKFKPKYLIQYPLSQLLGVKKIKNKRWDLPDPDDAVLKNFTSFFPLRGGFKLGKHIKRLRRNIVRLEARVLCFLSENDKVVPFEENRKTIQNSTDFTIMDLKKSGHFIPIDVEAPFVFDKTVEWLKK